MVARGIKRTSALGLMIRYYRLFICWLRIRGLGRLRKEEKLYIESILAVDLDLDSSSSRFKTLGQSNWSCGSEEAIINAKTSLSSKIDRDLGAYTSPVNQLVIVPRERLNSKMYRCHSSTGKSQIKQNSIVRKYMKRLA